MHSAIYQGTIRHRRFAPIGHEFEYRLFMLYVDLAELPTIFAGSRLWSGDRPALAWFRRADFLGPHDRPVDTAVRDLVQAKLGVRPTGPVRMLAHLRYFGHSFNPVSFYYCFDPAGERLVAFVAEITNTPWGERHCYVLQPGDATGDQAFAFDFPKAFHVSPFMPMDHQYRWRIAAPSDHLTVHMENWSTGTRRFDATLLMTREEITPASLRGALLRFPIMTIRVVAGIYWQAVKLWVKRAPFHPHPSKA